MEDIDILKGLKEDDENALNILISKYSKYISAVIINVSKSKISREDTEEICSDVFVNIWKKRRKIKLKNNDFKNYIASMAKNRTINFIRVKKPLQTELKENSALTPSAEYFCVSNEEVEFLKNSINELEGKDRELVIRRCFFSEKIADIAKVTNMNIKTVSSRILKAKRKLQKIITERNDIK